MTYHYRLSHKATLTLCRSDITKVAADAIVNAANEGMLGGGGVDGAIHRAAGRDLFEACKAMPLVAPRVRCPTGEARITPGFGLPARYVIHAVGPVYRGPQSATLLSGAYRAALKLARDKQLETIVFPAISCGVFGYPLPAAAAIAMETCSNSGLDFKQITFALFTAPALSAFQSAADRAFDALPASV